MAGRKKTKAAAAPEPVTYEMDGPAFKRLVERAASSAAKDDARPVLAGIKVAVESMLQDAPTITMVAADGYRLIETHADVKASAQDEFHAILNQADLRAVAKTCGKASLVTITPGRELEPWIFAVAPGPTFHVRPVDGTFPDHTKITGSPHPAKFLFAFNPTLLREVLAHAPKGSTAVQVFTRQEPVPGRPEAIKPSWQVAVYFRWNDPEGGQDTEGLTRYVQMPMITEMWDPVNRRETFPAWEEPWDWRGETAEEAATREHEEQEELAAATKADVDAQLAAAGVTESTWVDGGTPTIEE